MDNQNNNQVNTQEQTNNEEYNIIDEYIKPKKINKILVAIIIIVILIVIGIFVYNKYIKYRNITIDYGTTNIVNNNDEVKKKLVGTWLNDSIVTDQGVTFQYNLNFVINEDFSCGLDGTLKIGGTTHTLNTNGKCFLNDSGTKMKVVYVGKVTFPFYEKYTDFRVNDNTLVIGEDTYKRVSNN